jgi:hypothetical protein
MSDDVFNLMASPRLDKEITRSRMFKNIRISGLEISSSSPYFLMFVQSLCVHNTLDKLTVLDLEDLSTAIMLGIATLLRTSTTLRTLEIGYCSSERFDLLFVALQDSCVQSVAFTDLGLSAQDGMLIAPLVHRLQVLHLTDNPRIGETVLLKFAEELYRSSIMMELCIEGCTDSSRAVAAICTAAGTISSLQLLNLGHCPIQPCREALFTMLRNSKLRQLGLGHVKMDRILRKELFLVIKDCLFLEELNIVGDDVSCSEMHELITSSEQQHRTLQRIWYIESGSQFEKEQVRKRLEALHSWRSKVLSILASVRVLNYRVPIGTLPVDLLRALKIMLRGIGS